MATITVERDVDQPAVLAPPGEPGGPRFIVVPPPPPARHPGYGVGVWGMACVIATESFIFLALFATYFFLRASATSWPPHGTPLPELSPTWIFSIVLIASSLPVFWGEAAIKRGNVRSLQIALLVSFLMGAAFLGNEGWEWAHLGFSWTQNVYASLFFVITGLHGVHVLVGLAMNGQVQAKASMGKLTRRHHVSMQVFSLYWHFVDGVCIFVLLTVYVSVHIR